MAHVEVQVPRQVHAGAPPQVPPHQLPQIVPRGLPLVPAPGFAPSCLEQARILEAGGESPNAPHHPALPAALQDTHATCRTRQGARFDASCSCVNGRKCASEDCRGGGVGSGGAGAPLREPAGGVGHLRAPPPRQLATARAPGWGGRLRHLTAPHQIRTGGDWEGPLTRMAASLGPMRSSATLAKYLHPLPPRPPACSWPSPASGAASIQQTRRVLQVRGAEGAGRAPALAHVDVVHQRQVQPQQPPAAAAPRPGAPPPSTLPRHPGAGHSWQRLGGAACTAATCNSRRPPPWSTCAARPPTPLQGPPPALAGTVCTAGSGGRRLRTSRGGAPGRSSWPPGEAARRPATPAHPFHCLSPAFTLQLPRCSKSKAGSPPCAGCAAGMSLDRRSSHDCLRQHSGRASTLGRLRTHSQRGPVVGRGSSTRLEWRSKSGRHAPPVPQRCIRGMTSHG